MACLTNFNIHKPINKDFNTVDFSNLIFVRGGGVKLSLCYYSDVFSSINIVIAKLVSFKETEL